MEARPPKYLRTPDLLQTEAAVFANTLTLGTAATLVTLSGELGAGKTTFTQGLAAALGVTDSVTSPTFVLEKIYALTGDRSPFARLVHIDAYRLQSGSDLAALGFDEIMRDPRSLVVLEWPERVIDALPPAAVRISLAVEGEGRTITYA